MSGPAAEAPLAGTITGRVVASGTQLPLEAVQVKVVGTQIGGLTTGNGR
jgi:hypothetical protein